ncbi:unnamed protein product [Blepharisma stoltei]|uniref:Ubiquitin-like domain-containing protein n=1 Tax=Blepharisma stoltei TaxID=1481888 RepID=A0AAU9IMS0_9CILI|nr:unnamed protein product [Blepharisma stoltei]
MGGKSSTPPLPEMVTIAVIDINCFRISKQVNLNWQFSALVKTLSLEYNLDGGDLTIMYRGQIISNFANKSYDLKTLEFSENSEIYIQHPRKQSQLEIISIMIIDTEERSQAVSVYSKCLYKDLCMHIEWKYGKVLRLLAVYYRTKLLNYDKCKDKKISEISTNGMQNGDSLRIMKQYNGGPDKENVFCN